jgi:LytS/YehU family sensor histidine kinase
MMDNEPPVEKPAARTCVMQPLDSTQVEPRRAANLRTALAFASIAATFFVGIIAARILGGPVVGIGVMSVAVLLFLVFAIGRSLRR